MRYSWKAYQVLSNMPAMGGEQIGIESLCSPLWSSWLSHILYLSFMLLYQSYISKALILLHYSLHPTFPSLLIQSSSKECTQGTSCKLFASLAFTNPTDKLCLHTRFLANSEIHVCSPWVPWLNHSFPKTRPNYTLQAAIKYHLLQGPLLILHPWPSLLPLPYIT